MDNKKLKVKDLVSIGVFTVIYFALMFGIGMMGMIPILFLIYPTVLAIVAGTVVMLFMTKVQKPWALFIFGMISPLVMFAMGHTYVVLVISLIVMIIADPSTFILDTKITSQYLILTIIISFFCLFLNIYPIVS